MRKRSPLPVRLPAVVLGASLLAAAGLPAAALGQGLPYGYWPAPTYPQRFAPAGYYPAPAFPQRFAPAGYDPAPAYPQPVVPAGYDPAPAFPPQAPAPSATPPRMPPADAGAPTTTPQEPSTPQVPSGQAPAQAPSEAANAANQAAATAGETAPSTGAGGAALGGEGLTVKGDQLGIPGLAFGRPPRVQVAAVPSVRSFKIAEDESPVPLDRVYVDFNFFDNVNRSVNERLDSPVHNIEAYRETFGVEKTFLDGDASLGMRLPLNTLTSESTTPGLGGTSTDIGDLAIISKLVFCRDQQTGSLLSGGLALTTPTGPSHFADSNTFLPIHTWLLTPYVGYRWNEQNWYVQGFLSLDVPTGNDVTLLHNDVQIGYYLLRNKDEDAILTGITPQFEVHVNDPLDHRGALNLSDPLGTPDWIDLTAAVTFEMCHTSTLAIGFVTPVTGPKPYDFEVLAQFNWRFGRTARAAAGGPGNVLGE